MPSKSKNDLRSRLKRCIASHRRYKARLELLWSDHKDITRQYESLIQDHAPQAYREKYRDLLKRYRNLAARNQETEGAWPCWY